MNKITYSVFDKKQNKYLKNNETFILPNGDVGCFIKNTEGKIINIGIYEDQDDFRIDQFISIPVNDKIIGYNYNSEDKDD